MDNCIAELQNTPRMLRCLAAQRKRYAQAKWYRGIGVCLSIMGMMASYVTTIINEDKWIALLYLLMSVMALCCLVFNHIARYLQKQAASIQQYFDVTLFSKILGKERNIWGNLLSEAEIDSITCSVQEKEMKGLTTWYHCIPGISAESQVYRCQSENIRWNNKLYQWAIVGFWVMAILFLVGGFGVAILQEISVPKAVCALSWLLVPLGNFCVACFELTKTWVDWKSLNDENNWIWQMREQVNRNDFIQNLIHLQHGICELRATCFLLPDWLYGHFRKPFEDYEAQLAQNLQEEVSEIYKPSSPSAS